VVAGAVVHEVSAQLHRCCYCCC